VTTPDLIQLAYLVSVALFVVGLKRLSGVRTARRGNQLLAAGMLLAVVATLVEQDQLDLLWLAVGLGLGIAVGLITVVRATATSMPQVVARFNGFGGAASGFVALALYWQEVAEPAIAPASAALGWLGGTTLVLSVLIGGATFSGSVIAEAKLWGRLGGLSRLPARSALVVLTLVAALATGVGALVLDDAETASLVLLGLVVVALVAGVVTVGPVGGADMPVMISLLNSLSGLAAAATGFALGNTLLIMAGTIVGAAGLMLTRIMCAAMNRTLWNVLAGGFGGDTTAGGDASEYTSIVSSDAEEAAMVLEVARSVVIVPGYGLAAARGQHAAAELADTLAARGIETRFAIHPIAGRMPGHMNVVLAEADVPYERLVEMERINRDFSSTDVVIVVGANDVINPAARTASGSPISGMPILEVDQADRVFVIKRSLSPGYSGIKNELFEADNCVLLFGDAKQVLDDLVGHLQSSGA
jgi:NAD(P) transhydrogenase subunit beta